MDFDYPQLGFQSDLKFRCERLAHANLAKDVQLQKVRQLTFSEIEFLKTLAYQKFANYYVWFVSSRCAKIVALILLAYFVPLYSYNAYFFTHKSSTLDNFGKFLLPHTNTFYMAQDINLSEFGRNIYFLFSCISNMIQSHCQS